MFPNEVLKKLARAKVAGQPKGMMDLAVPTQDAQAAAHAMAAAGLTGFEVNQSYSDSKVTYFWFQTEPEFQAAEQILRDKFKKQIELNAPIWGEWTDENLMPDPSEVTSGPMYKTNSADQPPKSAAAAAPAAISFPLQQAYLCGNCDQVGNSSTSCPFCQSTALESVSKQLGGSVEPMPMMPSARPKASMEKNSPKYQRSAAAKCVCKCDRCKKGNHCGYANCSNPKNKEASSNDCEMQKKAWDDRGKRGSIQIPDVDKELLLEHFEGRSPEEILEEVGEHFGPNAMSQWVTQMANNQIEWANQGTGPEKESADKESAFWKESDPGMSTWTGAYSDPTTKMSHKIFAVGDVITNCPNCQKPIKQGEMVNWTSSGGEAHVNCPGGEAGGGRLMTPKGFQPQSQSQNQQPRTVPPELPGYGVHASLSKDARIAVNKGRIIRTASGVRIQRSRTKIAFNVKTAKVSVSQGQDAQGFHMLVNLNGTEYVLRGADAESFRKEFAAIPKPEEKVNALVERYLGKLQPYNQKPKQPAQQPAQKKPYEWPSYLQNIEKDEEAHRKKDEENYWAGKGAPNTTTGALKSALFEEDEGCPECFHPWRLHTSEKYGCEADLGDTSGGETGPPTARGECGCKAKPPQPAVVGSTKNKKGAPRCDCKDPGCPFHKMECEMPAVGQFPSTGTDSYLCDDCLGHARSVGDDSLAMSMNASLFKLAAVQLVVMNGGYPMEVHAKGSGCSPP